MTREEAIRHIESINPYVGRNIKEAFDMAIKALEQQSVLDKIKADIEEYKSRQLALAIDIEKLEKGKQTALDYVLAIIDEHKAESEVQK